VNRKINSKERGKGERQEEYRKKKKNKMVGEENITYGISLRFFDRVFSTANITTTSIISREIY